MRISLTLPAMVLAATASPAAAALSTGNIAFTCFNADRDAVAFVALAPIPAGEIIRFCDSEWNGGVIGSGGAFGSDEGDIAWTAPAGGVAAGTVVVIDNYDTTPVPSVGTVSGGSGLSSSDETIYAYQGASSRQPTVFLASIANHNDGTPDSIANTGLTLGQTALLLPNGTDFAQYTGPRAGQASLSAYLPLTGDVATNWTSGGEGDFAGTIPSATPFTVGVTSVDLANYVRVGRYDLPEPSRTAAPDEDNLLCEEASGVTYNWDTDSLFIVGDGGRSVTQVSTSGALIDSMTLADGPSAQGTEFYDTEGITYIGNNEFVMTEERDRRLVKFTYAAGTTLTRSATQTVTIGTFNDNMGTEGLSYDPLSGGFICLKEITPMGIFQTGVDFAAGTATNGSASTENSTDLFDPALTGLTDVADVFALSNLPSMDGQVQEENLVIVSQEDGKIININRSGVISSSLSISSDPGNPLSVAAQQHEGITMDREGVIYVVNENGGGDIRHPQLWVYAPATAPNTAPTAVALANSISSILENTGTVARIKVADIIVTDDGLGTNTLSLSGADAEFFEVVGGQLFIKAGTTLDFEAKDSYSLTLSVDDVTLGATPDATTTFTLNVTDVEPEAETGPSLVISEVAPWSSGNSPVELRVDWFEVTNVSKVAVDISGWKVDDASPAIATAATLNGVTSIAPGESVIFLNTTDLAGKAAAFKTLWFGANPPASLQIGSYNASGIGLSTDGDEVNLFDAEGQIATGITFGANAGGPTYRSFDNGAGLDGEAVSLLSTTGVFGAFVAANDPAEIGSPGTIGRLIVSEVAAWASGNSPAGADWFEPTNQSARPINLTGWRIDDNTASPLGGATPLNGITSIAPGESVIFLESATPATTIPLFLNTWFGANPPANLQVGSFTENGLSTGGDAVHIYDGTVIRANVFFAASDSSAPYASFDNAAGINNAFISQLSYPGVNGAFVAQTDPNEIGSPGTLVNSGPLSFEFWLAVNGFSSGGFDLDSDQDGLSDGLEYVLSLNPNDASDAADAIELVNSGSGLQFGYSRLNGVTDAAAPLQISSNLLDWSAAIEGLDYSVQAQATSGLQTDVTLNLLGSGPSAPGTSPDYLTPNVTPAAGASLGGVRIVNHGLVGAGRLSGENLDQFGETQGASSSLFVTEWAYNEGQFSGVFNVLPDRGFNVGDLFSNYAARLHRVEFTFTPYYGSSPVPQGQIAPSYVSSTKFTYQDGATTKFTTGFNPTGVSTLFGQPVGTVTTANGPAGAQTPLLSLDAEAVYLFPDGSGYVSDEYGTYIARFNPAKQITGITQLPAAAQPNNPTGVLNFDSVATPASGRRNNQGLEGMSVTPDGNKLFALMQSALVQDTNGAQQQTRNNTRLYVYDIAGANREAPVLVAEYVVKLPRFDANGDGSGLDRTAAQSEIVAVGNAAFLMLPRDGNGLGTGTATPTVLKSVRVVDFASATNILGIYDGGGVAISPGGVLDPSIVPAASAEVINMLAPADLAKFGFNTNNAAADSNTINEKWEGMSLVPDISTPEANDFFLFVANDNDFQSSDVRMLDGNGVVVSQGDRRLNAGITNDAMYLAYRITLDVGSHFYRLSVTEN